MATKETSRNLYIKESKKALGRILREGAIDYIPNIKDKRCRVFKLGSSVDDIVREGQLRSTAYGGVNDWEFVIYEGNKCSFSFSDGLDREGKFHKWLRNANGIHHLRANRFPWLYDKDGHESTEVYFGNPISVAKYIRNTLLADPVELAALRNCREQIESMKKEYETLAKAYDILSEKLQNAQSAANGNRSALLNERITRETAEANLSDSQRKHRDAMSRKTFWRNCFFGLLVVAISEAVIIAKHFY